MILESLLERFAPPLIDEDMADGTASCRYSCSQSLSKPDFSPHDARLFRSSLVVTEAIKSASSVSSYQVTGLQGTGGGRNGSSLLPDLGVLSKSVFCRGLVSFPMRILPGRFLLTR